MLTDIYVMLYRDQGTGKIISKTCQNERKKTHFFDSILLPLFTNFKILKVVSNFFLVVWILLGDFERNKFKWFQKNSENSFPNSSKTIVERFWEKQNKIWIS